MKAAVYKKYGSPEVLHIADVQKPKPGDHQVLVKVIATTVNRTDCANLRAKPFFMRLVTGLVTPKKKIPGTDFAGEVEAVGNKVTRFKAGDRVFGFDDTGSCSHAQYLVIDESKGIGVIPKGLSYELAAASIEGVHYAINFLNKVNIEPGQSILVNGATGAIGSAAVQLLKYHGVNVTAVCKGENKELVESLGAKEVIDYTRQDFTKIHEAFDFVFDTVGKSTFGKCRHLLKPKGSYISSELGPLAQNVPLSIATPLFKGRDVKFPVPVDTPKSIEFISKLIEEKQFKAVIDRQYPLDRVVDAFHYVESGEKIGNVVIQVSM